MPPDADLTEDLIRQYDEVRKHFVSSPDERALRLLLNSFGDGSGFGVYQLVEDAITVHDASAVVEALKEAVQSPHRGVRYWSLQIAAAYVDRDLVEIAKALWPSLDVDSRFWAAQMISQQYDPAIDRLFLRKALDQESDSEVRSVIEPLVG